MPKLSNKAMAFLMGFVAISAGALTNYLGDKLLGVRLELFWGIGTFSPIWVLDVFLVPFIAGMVVSLIYGLGGKLLCYFAPLIPRIYSYIEMQYFTTMPEGVTVLPFYYWILVVILVVEAAAFGGVFGEIVIKKTYGRRPKHLVYKTNDAGQSASSEK